jgi:hypothetical protein
MSATTAKMGHLELSGGSWKDRGTHYPTPAFFHDVQPGGFHKYTFPALAGAGFDALECSLDEQSPLAEPNWWESPPVLCIMGPTFSDCTNEVDIRTPPGGKPQRRTFLRREGTLWQTATLLTVTSQDNLREKRNVDEWSPGTYALSCVYTDR